MSQEKQKTVHDLSVSELAEFLAKSVEAAEGQGAGHIVLHIEVVKRVAKELAELDGRQKAAIEEARDEALW